MPVHVVVQMGWGGGRERESVREIGKDRKRCGERDIRGYKSEGERE